MKGESTAQNYSKEGYENEEQESSDEGVLESSEEDGDRDEEELKDNLDAGPSEEAGQGNGQRVVGVRRQEISPAKVECARPLAFPLHISTSVFTAAIGNVVFIFRLHPVGAIPGSADKGEGPPRPGATFRPSLDQETERRWSERERGASMEGDGREGGEGCDHLGLEESIGSGEAIKEA